MWKLWTSYLMAGTICWLGTASTSQADQPVSHPLSVAAEKLSRLPQQIAAASLDGTSWQLLHWRVGGVSISPLPKTSITANFAAGRVSGSGGCNSYNASVTTSSNSLTIGPAASTRKACPTPIMRQEARYFEALAGAKSYGINPQGQLEITYQIDRRTGVLVFQSTGTAAVGLWLDQSQPTNWNKPGMSLPKAPKSDNLAADFSRCRDQIRPSTTAQDRAVTSAGWKLYGPFQQFGSVALVNGFSAVDGMCRPMGYQNFVFVNGRFAGTLSPQPMDSRTNGASNRIYLFRESELTAEFSRYKDSDALCCPSASSSVTYQIQQQGGLPVVVPVSVSTSPTN